MIKLDTVRIQVKSLIKDNPQGLSLTELHSHVYKLVTRLQLRTLLGELYRKELISRERRKVKGFKTTLYLHFTGNAITVRKKRNKIVHSSGNELSYKDFLDGHEFAPFLPEGNILGEDKNTSPILFIPNTLPNYE